MKILKRNQLIILVIALMLITAGYLNYSSNEKNIASTDETLGDATLVSANVAEEVVENESEEKITTEETENEIVETISQEDYYFINSKLDRNAMYSELLESYQELYNNENATAEEKTNALNKINEINNIKNSIMISENLISAKGIEDLVVFVNENSVSVVVKGEIEQEQIAQIQNIISRELNVEVDRIHISNK